MKQNNNKEIKKKFYKIKDKDKLTLTGKQLREFAEYNRNSKEKEITIKALNQIEGISYPNPEYIEELKQKLKGAKG